MNILVLLSHCVFCAAIAVEFVSHSSASPEVFATSPVFEEIANASVAAPEKYIMPLKSGRKEDSKTKSSKTQPPTPDSNSPKTQKPSAKASKTGLPRDPSSKPSISPTTLTIPPMPVTPAPTPCEAQRFFFVNGVCTNDIFLLGGNPYGSAMECCNVNYGSGSMLSGACNYVDICNTPMPTLPPVGPTPTTPVLFSVPSSPAPTSCEDLLFFFNGFSCSNEVFIASSIPYTSVITCCDMNFGSGSMMNGSCVYIDICNTLPPSPVPFVTTTPSTAGSTPTI